MPRYPDGLLFLHRKTIDNALRCKSKRQKSSPQPTGGDLQSKAIKALESEIARLQVALKEERLRADAYNELIHVAETKFRIAIRKKVGAKR
jgi:hypothetical protein